MESLALIIVAIIFAIFYYLFVNIQNYNLKKQEEKGTQVPKKNKSFINSLSDSDFIDFYENLNYRNFKDYFNYDGSFMDGHKDYIVEKWSTDKYVIKIHSAVGERGFTEIRRKIDNKKIR